MVASQTIKLSCRIRHLVKPPKTAEYPMVLVEDHPQKRLLSFRGELFLLPLPWTYYKIILSSPGWIDSIFMSPTRITSKTQWLSQACLPNMYGDTPCYSATGTLTDVLTKKELIAHSLENFWNDEFNTDGPVLDHDVCVYILKRLRIHRAYELGRVADALHRVLKYWEAASFKEVAAWPWPSDMKYKDVFKQSLYLRAVSDLQEETYGYDYGDDDYDD